jgi:hypothetical protein
MTDKYKVQVCRLFRGHPIPVKPAESFSVGHLTSFRALVRKAKQVAGLNNIKCVTEDRGDRIIITTESRTHQLEVQYCQA